MLAVVPAAAICMAPHFARMAKCPREACQHTLQHSLLLPASHAADAACDLLTPAELGSPRVVRTLLNYGSTLAVAANVRGDPWRCCALVVHEPPLAAVIDGMLRSDGALRALVARMSLAGLLDARSPHQFLVELLRLAPQACLARVQRERWTPLHLAAAGGNVRATAVLLEAVPEAAYAEDLDGRLPMHCACAQGHVGIVRLLLRAAPETAAMLAHDSEEDAMDAAIVCGHPEVVKVSCTHASGAECWHLNSTAEHMLHCLLLDCTLWLACLLPQLECKLWLAYTSTCQGTYCCWFGMSAGSAGTRCGPPGGWGQASVRSYRAQPTRSHSSKLCSCQDGSTCICALSVLPVGWNSVCVWHPVPAHAVHFPGPMLLLACPPCRH